MSDRSARHDDEGAAEQAERLEREADRMEERSGQLGKEVEDHRSDWESKQQDDTVPGAQSEEAIESELPEAEDDEEQS